MRTSRRVPVLISSVLLAIATLGCAPARVPEPAVRLTPCRIDGLAEEIKCGTVSVPEDRGGASDRRLSIHVAIVPALARVPEPDPLVLLAGGPGQAASSFGPWIGSVFAPIRRHRDIVLIDQRGTGKSHALKCEGDRPDEAAVALRREDDASRACLATLDGDPRHYASGSAMEDLDAIRAALGYAQINVWGGSYGTRAALVYMRTHPDRVRSAVLDGVAPWSLRFPLYTARDGERALLRLLDDCGAARECAGAFPQLRAHLADVLRRLTTSPSTVTSRDPRTGEARSLRITRDEFAVALRGFLYVATLASAVPLVIERAYAGDFEPFQALRQAVSAWSMETMSLGMTRSVLCSEDVPRILEDEIDAATRGTVVGAGGSRLVEGLLRALAAGRAAGRCRCPRALRWTGAPALRRPRSGRSALMGRGGSRHDAPRPTPHRAGCRPQRNVCWMRAGSHRDVHRAGRRDIARCALPRPAHASALCDIACGLESVGVTADGTQRRSRR